ncbi:interphotoreceptor matrix proteoglycan 2-like [Micropterus salmoides]|uniref:interphotoreceptor matrix proteoglycan 2-like n=1 Tax=Micropterus salmoides TaxID=27706 RepID=UPI0018EC8C4B|nr:interphotoreceptor matrix proteoglycan 2-like [Micropterus salmoides]
MADLPQNSAVAQTLVEAVNNTNNSFNVSINPNTVLAVAGPVPSTTTVPTAAAPTTTASTTVALITSRVTFRSVQSTFTSDLNNPSSAAFIVRASMIKTKLEPVFQRAFPSSFNSLDVVSFRNGSIINEMNVRFASTFVPNNTQIASVLISAASTVTGFDIEGSSINVNGTPSSGVSHKISFITASCLVLLSWILSSQR